MRYLTAVLVMLFWMNSSRAQLFEIGPYLGGSNYIGDVGSTNYINPNSLAFGGIAKWNRSLRHSWRLSVIHTELKADDADSNQGRRVERGYSFSNGLTEVMLGIEFNFWEFDVFSSRPQIVPYLSTGIAGIFTHEMYVDKNDDGKEGIYTKKNKFGFALPMIIGVKGKITRDLILAVEIGARMSFYDTLDGSTEPSGYNPEEHGVEKYPSFGNQNTNDWYMFTGVTLTYTFGHNPCYDTF